MATFYAALSHQADKYTFDRCNFVSVAKTKQSEFLFYFYQTISRISYLKQIKEMKMEKKTPVNQFPKYVSWNYNDKKLK